MNAGGGGGGGCVVMMVVRQVLTITPSQLKRKQKISHCYYGLYNAIPSQNMYLVRIDA